MLSEPYCAELGKGDMPIIKIVPVKTQKLIKKNQLMSFAGLGKGCWDETTQDVNNSVQDLRDSWSRKGKLSLKKNTIFRERV